MERLTVLSIAIVALVSLPAAVLSAKVQKPRVKWGQDKNQLYVSVVVRDLDTASISVSLPTEGDLSFKAKNTKGEEFALDLPLREDVKIDTLKWELPARSDKWGTACLVTVAKQNQHRWDLLTSDPKSFKGLIDKDWSREDQTLEPEEETPYVEDNAGVLVDLTEKNFDKTVSKYNAVIINTRYPWCSQCKSQDDTFVKAAKKAKSNGKKDKAWKKIAFGVVDARENRKLARKFGAKCDYNCVYKVLVPKESEDPIDIKSQWSEDLLMGDIKKYLGPAVNVVKDAKELDDFKEKNTTCFGGFATESGPAYARFKRVANLLRGQIVFAASFGTEQQVELWPHKQNFSFKFDGVAEDNGTELLAWAKPRAVPLLQHYDWQLRETYESLGLPLAKVWIDDSDSNPSLDKVVRHAVRRVAKKFIGKIAFVEQKKSSYSYELRDFGLNRPELYPAFGIASNASYNSVKYGFEVVDSIAPSVQDFWKDADKAIPVLSDFCEKVLAGTWPEAHESDYPHTNWTKGTVKRLVWKTYNEIATPEKPLLLQMYGRYRQDNEKKTQEVSNMAEAFADHADAFTVATYDTSDNYWPQDLFVREKYSSDSEWYWVPLSSEGPPRPLAKPKKDPSIKTVIEFAKKQSGLDFDVDAVNKRFEELMVEKPPVTTTFAPPPKLGDTDMGELGDKLKGMDGLGGLEGLEGLEGLGSGKTEL